MPTKEEIAQLALELPPDDRAYVADLLGQSLTSDDVRETSLELLTELERRSAAYRAGTMSASPGDEVLEALQARRAKRFGR